jgi:hypothetical protein
VVIAKENMISTVSFKNLPDLNYSTVVIVYHGQINLTALKVNVLKRLFVRFPSNFKELKYT